MKKSTIVITGANRGLGLELCRQLRSDHEIIATARVPEAADDLRALGPRVEAMDVADTASVNRFAARLADQAVDILINNAGRGPARVGIAGLDFESSRLDLEVNSLGPMRVTQALLPHLRRGNGRRIVHISSDLGSLSRVDDDDAGGYYVYRASKAALNMLNICLARELAGEGFTCVALHPGWVQTDMGGVDAPLKPDESVRGMVRVIRDLTTADNGRFMDYQGATLRW